MSKVYNSLTSSCLKYVLVQKVISACLVLSLWLSTINLSAQDRFAITCGAGKYELINLGVQWKITENSALSTNAGTNFGIDDKQLYSVGLTFDQVFVKPLNWKVKPGYSFGAIYWTQDDEWYYFKTLTFPLMVTASYALLPNLTVRAEGGIVLSQNLVSDRKQNTTAGFPERFDENYQLSFIYRLNRHEK